MAKLDGKVAIVTGTSRGVGVGVLPDDDPTGADHFRNVPLGRAGEPDEVGRTCVFLCSGEADFINGTTIEVDGGMLPGVLHESGLKTITDLL